ncbi:hypothetical protein BDR26DRAFT_947195, partial [Obelidium mucronatum]
KIHLCRRQWFFVCGPLPKTAGWEGVFPKADIAVKVQMKKSDPSGHYFYKEVAVMSKLGHHENIVEFYGYSNRTRLHFFIMMELCDTALFSFLPQSQSHSKRRKQTKKSASNSQSRRKSILSRFYPNEASLDEPNNRHSIASLSPSQYNSPSETADSIKSFNGTCPRKSPRTSLDKRPRLSIDTGSPTNPSRPRPASQLKKCPFSFETLVGDDVDETGDLILIYARVIGSQFGPGKETLLQTWIPSSTHFEDLIHLLEHELRKRMEGVSVISCVQANIRWIWETPSLCTVKNDFGWNICLKECGESRMITLIVTI